VEKTSLIFNKITKTIVKVSSLETAELIKLLDNAYRDITISIGNLCGKICESLNLDSHEVIEAANYGYSRNNILFPGAGVGGGCLMKDSYLLLSSLTDLKELDLVRTARKINDSMIQETINLIESSYTKISRNVSKSNILVLGFAFKGFPYTDDIRFSPTLPIIEYLKKSGANIYGFDSFVSAENILKLGIKHVSDIYGKEKFDTIIIMNNNPKFKNLNFKKLIDKSLSPLLVIDGWYMYNSNNMNKLGIKYFALGSKNEI